MISGEVPSTVSVQSEMITKSWLTWNFWNYHSSCRWYMSRTIGWIWTPRSQQSLAGAGIDVGCLEYIDVSCWRSSRPGPACLVIDGCCHRYPHIYTLLALLEVILGWEVPERSLLACDDVVWDRWFLVGAHGWEQLLSSMYRESLSVLTMHSVILPRVM